MVAASVNRFARRTLSADRWNLHCPSKFLWDVPEDRRSIPGDETILGAVLVGDVERVEGAQRSALSVAIPCTA